MEPTQAQLNDPDFFISNFFKIESKEQKIVRFVPNQIQKSYLKTKTNRDVILKARQPGVSSFILALMLYECLWHENCKGVVISHERETTIRLLRRVKFYLDHLPMQEKLEFASQHELTFPNTNSSIFIGTAGQRAFGRGDTVNFLHCSEIAQWPRPEETLAALLQAVPIGGKAIIESTANGVGTWYEEFWNKAVNGDSTWSPNFYPWYMTAEYRVSGDPLTDLNEEEHRLKDIFNIDDDQLRWRRWKISEMPDPVYFKQEYPTTAEEAFISTRNCVFDVKVIRQLLDMSDPGAKFNLNVHDFEEAENGYVTRWFKPNINHHYVIGADVGTGVENGDPSCAIVYDTVRNEQVAEWHGLIAPDGFAIELQRLGHRYNNALIAVERNNPGISTIVKLYELQYPNIYKEKRMDAGAVRDTNKLGLFTSAKTKTVVINSFKSSLGRGLKIYSKRTLRECLGFVYKPRFDQFGYVDPTKSKMEAESGHDDCVMAAAIGCFAMNELPNKAHIPEQEILPFTLPWFDKPSRDKEKFKYKVGNF